MGAVYSAQHKLLSKSVALKTFGTNVLTEHDVLRFQKEAQALAKLDHPNIVKVLDFGFSQDNLPYYTMELLRGQSLAESLENAANKTASNLTLAEILDLFIHLCDRLSQAHHKGIVHRDIKPDYRRLLRQAKIASHFGRSQSKTKKSGNAFLARLEH
jgi:serine/threonine protein kinase